MRIINVTASGLGPLVLGMQGESGATEVRLAVPGTLDGYSVTVYHSIGGAVYPVTDVTVADGVIAWRVGGSDTAVVGRGEMQVRFSDGDGTVVKTLVYPTAVMRSIDGDPGPAPEPYETWLASLTSLAEETEGYARAAAEDAEEIRSMTATAETLEAGAEATASYADGVLSFGIPAGPAGPTGPAGPKGDTGERGPAGETGERGPRGETGATGQRGEQGPKGDAFTYSDFTPEQLAALTGPQGERGPAGPQGIQGVQGVQGETGATPDISIGTVTTGAAGTDAAATITGTPESPVLNLTIPRGNPGEVTQAELDAAIVALCPQKTVGPSALVSVTDARRENALDVTIGIEPVQSGSGDPSPENVRPITGWTGATLTRAGKNLFDVGRETGTPTQTDIYTSPRVMSTDKAYVGLRADNYYYAAYVSDYTNVDGVLTLTTRNNNNYGVGFPVDCKGSTTYTLSVTKANGAFSVGCYDDEWNFILKLVGVTGDASAVTFTTPSNARYLTLVFGSAPVGTSGTISNIQLEPGSTATAYEPYQGDIYSITFPTEAGTVYGGTLDVTTGVLTVDRAQITSYAGETLPGTWISDRDVYSAGATPTTGAQVVYELATPITYQLTLQQIALLRGNNTIFADTGDTTLTYRRDIAIILSNL